LPVHAATSVLKQKVGDAKDQASLGLAMLRAMGVDGFAVLASRAGSFASIPDLPTPAPYNHVVIAVPDGGNYLFIDPSTPGLPAGRLPGALQGGKGLLVRNDGGDLIDLPADAEEKNNVDVLVDLKMSEDGTLTGVVKASCSGVDAAAVRNLLQRDDEEAAKKNGALLQDILLGARFGAPDWPQTIEIQDVFRSVDARTKTADDTLRVQGRVVKANTKNMRVIVDEIIGRPFGFLWREGRRSSVFLDHARVHNVRLQIALPKGFGVAQLPTSLEKAGPLASLVERWAVADGILFFQRTLTNHERVVPPERYGELRALVTSSWARAQEAVAIVPGGDRGAAYNGDPF
jgi:hypothetical protein